MGTTFNIKRTPIDDLNLDIGHFIFYQNILVGEFAEGVHVTFENAAVLIQIATQRYGTEAPFIYISHRKHSYSMNPVGYKEVLELFPNFKALGIVPKNKRGRMLANLERLFLKKPIRVFDTLEEAMLWAESLLLQKIEP